MLSPDSQEMALQELVVFGGINMQTDMSDFAIWSFRLKTTS